MTAQPADRRGRPRSLQADQAITEAVLDVLAEQGIAHFTIEAVATREGVGKATIYRRFSGRDDLLAAALERLGEDLPTLPEVGDARTRLTAHLDLIRVPMADTRSGRIMSQLIAAGPSDPELLAVLFDRVVAPRRNALAETLRAGIDEGWVAQDADIDAAVTMLVGAMMYVKLWWGSQQEFPSTAAVIDAALAGVGITPRLRAIDS
jgi:AcrR family transcriptional regulator